MGQCNWVLYLRGHNDPLESLMNSVQKTAYIITTPEARLGLRSLLWLVAQSVLFTEEAAEPTAGRDLCRPHD